MTEKTKDELLKELRARNRRDRWWYNILRGMLSGIGAVLGVVLLVYLLLPVLEKTPVIGPYLTQYTTPIQDTANQRLPEQIRHATPTPTPTPTPTSSDSNVTGSSKIKADVYRITLPAGWNLSLKEGSMGVQLSRLTAESDDYASHSDDAGEGPFSPVYYDSGAMITIHVTEPADSGLHGQTFSEKEIDIDGETATWHQFAEPSTFSGVQYDVHFDHAGRSYLIQFAAAEDYPNPEDAFQDILDSFEFVD